MTKDIAPITSSPTILDILEREIEQLNSTNYTNAVGSKVNSLLQTHQNDSGFPLGMHSIVPRVHEILETKSLQGLLDKIEMIDLIKYNTEDGQIRWCEDNDYTNISLTKLWEITPMNIKKQMTEWKKMIGTMNHIKEIRSKILSMSPAQIALYNTEDGQIRWCEDHGYRSMVLGSFWSMIPDSIKKQMVTWRKLNYSVVNAKIIRHQFLNMSLEKILSYNTEDGQIRWCEDHGYPNMNLGELWRIIPNETRVKMTEWKKIFLSMKTTKTIREGLLSMKTGDIARYNTEDGQIRWCEDNNFLDINLAQFWTVIPNEIKVKMTEWRMLCLNISDTKTIRHALLNLSPEDIKKYNTEDGLVRWINDHKYTTSSTASICTIIPKKVFIYMTEWKFVQGSIEQVLVLQSKLLNLSPEDIKKYNTETGITEWLKDNNITNLSLNSFFPIIPASVRSKMPLWKRYS